VLEFCERNMPGPVAVADMASAAGVSVRTLQREFRDRFATTPSDYLRKTRLDGVRHDLLRIRQGQAEGSVTDVALRWGFTHLGWFGVHYRRQFGESASRTLDCRAGNDSAPPPIATEPERAA
jgi:transcriptional regulator GlxA family with amidase domain